MVPDGTECDDGIFLLEGGAVPFILRESARHTAARPSREVIGEAHVPGIMNGELWEEVKDRLEQVCLV